MVAKAVRIVLSAALFVVCVVVGPARAERVQDLPKPTNYVNDYAGVLSANTKAQLDDLCAQVDHQAHAQIVVVTVKSLDGEEPLEYSTSLYHTWGIGQKGSDRGVLLLLAVNDRKRSIRTGYGLEGILPDSKTGDIGRQMVPSLKTGDYDAAVTLAVNQFAQAIAADAGITLQSASRRGPPQAKPVHVSLGQIIFFLVVLFFIIVFLARAGGGGLLGFLLGMFLGGGGRGGWGGGGGGGGDGGGFGGFGGGDSGGGGSDGNW